MPQNALIHVSPDHCVPLAKMGELVEKLVAEPPRPDQPVPPEVAVEVEIAFRAMGGVPDVDSWGRRSPVSCPDCGGALWQNDEEQPDRYRCHTGHAYSGLALFTAQSAEIEKTLWTALRMFEERKVLLTTMAAKNRPSAPSLTDTIAELEGHARQIRDILSAGTGISIPAADPEPYQQLG